MARKHHRPQVHYGNRLRSSVCGLPFPRIGAGLTKEPGSVTCQACLAILEQTSAPSRPDPYAQRQYRIAVREYAKAVGIGDVRVAGRVGHQQGPEAVPVR